MKRSWPSFAATIRGLVASAAVVAELLDCVLNGDRFVLSAILDENHNNAGDLRRLVRVASSVAQSYHGRIEVGRLAAQYKFEAGWPTDDITIRRVYELYRSGELGKHLPSVSRRIA